MLRIDKDLFQWEKGRVAFMDPPNPDVSVIEFYNEKSIKSKECTVINGAAQIPDELLQVDLPITALACSKNLNGTRVIARNTFKVFARPEPEEYEPGSTPDDPSKPTIPGVDIVFDGGEVK